jgi:hypothetical protein
MTYRASANEPMTRWARHLDAVMRERGWSRVRLFEEVGAELGYAPKSRSAMLPLLADKEPTPAQAAVLRRHFGEPPLDDPAASSAHTEAAGSSDLAAAIREQTAAMLELVAELRLSRAEQVGMNEGLVAVAAQVAKVLEARADNGR